MSDLRERIDEWLNANTPDPCRPMFTPEAPERLDP